MDLILQQICNLWNRIFPIVSSAGEQQAVRQINVCFHCGGIPGNGKQQRRAACACDCMNMGGINHLISGHQLEERPNNHSNNRLLFTNTFANFLRIVVTNVFSKRSTASLAE